MGRTVPTWRGRVEQEIEILVPYRRALSHEDRCRFDAMLHDVRMRRGRWNASCTRGVEADAFVDDSWRS